MKRTVYVCDICKTECKQSTLVILPKKETDWCMTCYTNLLDVIEGRRCFPATTEKVPDASCSKCKHAPHMTECHCGCPDSFTVKMQQVGSALAEYKGM